MNLDIQQKRALIVGAHHGLAKAIALELAHEGVIVAVVSDDAPKMNRILHALGGSKLGHAAFAIDLVREGNAKKLFNNVKKSFGHVDIIVNCLDTYAYTGKLHTTIDGWRKIFRNNLEIAIEINNLFIPQMKQRNWGRIINLSSGASMEHSATVSYCASKAALTAYTRCMGRILAIEASNVVMSAVLPGAMLMEDGYWQKVSKTKPNDAKEFLRQNSPSGRFGKPEEISPMVAMLCSSLATYCQGAIIPIDGGQARHYYNVERS